MNVASLELCKKLYELVGWEDTLYYVYERTDPKSLVEPHLIGNSKMGITVRNASTGFDEDEYDILIPAYDLGYLLRKLPATIDSDCLVVETLDGDWYFHYLSDEYISDGRIYASAGTPENAAAHLAIELFRQGVLTRSGDGA